MQYVKALFLGFVLLLGGCSLDPVSTAASALIGNKPALAVDAQVGGEKTQALQANDANHIEVSDSQGPVAVTTTKTKHLYEGVQQVVVREDVPLNFWLLMILGWLLPSPGEMYREIKSWFIGFFNLFRRQP